VRPTVTFLGRKLIEQIISEARGIMCKLGFEIHNDGVIEMLAGHGARVDKSTNRVHFTEDMIDKALPLAPHAFKLYDAVTDGLVELARSPGIFRGFSRVIS